MQTLTGGYINDVFKVSQAGGAPDAALVVRVFGTGAHVLTDPSTQVVAMRAAQLGGCGAEVLASFTNGIVYRFAVGNMLDTTLCQDAHIRR